MKHKGVEVVHEVGAWAERRLKGAEGAAQRAALTLAAQRVGPLPAPLMRR